MATFGSSPIRHVSTFGRLGRSCRFSSQQHPILRSRLTVSCGNWKLVVSAVKRKGRYLSQEKVGFMGEDLETGRLTVGNKSAAMVMPSTASAVTTPLPEILRSAGEDAITRFVEYFTAHIRNPHTR